MSEAISDEAQIAGRLMEGRETDPFSVLGPHQAADGWIVRTFQPGALSVDVVTRGDGRPMATLSPVGGTGVFCGLIKTKTPYTLQIRWPDATQETEDPYSFGVVLGELDLHLFSQGAHFEMGRRFGAQPMQLEAVEGVAFSVWAPNARRVAVIGDFNAWDGRRHGMRLRHEAGVWELFVPRLASGARYKFEITGLQGEILQKADPLARQTEKPPATASVVAPVPAFSWNDPEWMVARGDHNHPGAPLSIYEVHLASWLRPEGEPLGELNWGQLAERLIPYVADLGFTHVELLPIMEHPFGGSWGYQPLSQFAPSARFGPPEAFAGFVDACHKNGIGVILDWVPAHFPTDAHGLERFDGTSLYEYADPKEGFHQDWNSLIYNFGRNEVQGFLIASALYWLEIFHVDGLRVDAVASMLYRDYSRKAGEWIPNRYGGRENLEAIEFIKRLNGAVLERAPGALMIAEESTAWPGVSAPLDQGGLGFNYKWNMGWMHDTLSYVELDSIYRSYHHSEMTFGMIYAYSERFILPLSHDEVVHGKGSLIGKMPGDDWQKFANLRAYFSFMWAHPGKKLIFMGDEIAQRLEWNHDAQVAWFELQNPRNSGMQRLIGDLNRLYRAEPALHATDADPAGFQWLVGDDSKNSVFAFIRRADGRGAPLLFIVNFTPMPRYDYRIGTPVEGAWRTVFNSDAEVYGGGNVGGPEWVHTEKIPAHGNAVSLPLVGAALGGDCSKIWRLRVIMSGTVSTAVRITSSTGGAQPVRRARSCSAFGGKPGLTPSIVSRPKRMSAAGRSQ